MKKFLSAFLALAMMLSIALFATACAGEQSSQSGKGEQIEKPSDNNHGENNSTIVNSWLTGQKVYGMESTNFSNGMAVISSIDGDEKTLYGIDKKGNLLFSLENHSTLYEKKQFINGLLYIYNWENDTIGLMDDTGKIITAEDLGGTQFVSFNNKVYGRSYWVDMFEDGYVIVNKVVTTFQGTTYESAIFDENLNVVVDYSERLYPVIYDSYADSTYEGQMYILGNLVWEEYENGNVIYYVLDFQSSEIKKYNERLFQGCYSVGRFLYECEFDAKNRIAVYDADRVFLFRKSIVYRRALFDLVVYQEKTNFFADCW